MVIWDTADVFCIIYNQDFMLSRGGGGQWSVGSPTTLTIRVRFLLKVFQFSLCVKLLEINEKRSQMAI